MPESPMHTDGHASWIFTTMADLAHTEGHMPNAPLGRLMLHFGVTNCKKKGHVAGLGDEWMPHPSNEELH